MAEESFKMKPFTKAVIIKTIGIVLSSFLVATSTFFYFNTEYKYHFFLVFGIMIGVGIFIFAMKYEPEFEPIKDNKNGTNL